LQDKQIEQRSIVTVDSGLIWVGKIAQFDDAWRHGGRPCSCGVPGSATYTASEQPFRCGQQAGKGWAAIQRQAAGQVVTAPVARRSITGRVVGNKKRRLPLPTSTGNEELSFRDALSIWKRPKDVGSIGSGSPAPLRRSWVRSPKGANFRLWLKKPLAFLMSKAL